MKPYIFLFSLMVSLNVCAQKSTELNLGTIEYYEGVVKLGIRADYKDAKIDMPVFQGQYIKTLGDALAEIRWKNGTLSLVGPSSTISISDLQEGANSDAAQKAEGSFSNFKAIFSKETTEKRSQEGGIRRDEVKIEARSKGDIYWKKDEEVAFDDAYSYYESKDFKKAIPSLQTFLHQKPNDPMAKYAYFALGHSYILTNNSIEAKEIFDEFMSSYPDDILFKDAKKIRAALD